MSELKDLPNVNGLSEQRLWKTLDSISERLTGIERQLGEVVRLEERVNNHEHIITRHSTRLDNIGKRIHDAELWQAGYGDKNDLRDIKQKVDALESNKDIIKGQRDVGKEILKWLAGILGAVIIFMTTNW